MTNLVLYLTASCLLCWSSGFNKNTHAITATVQVYTDQGQGSTSTNIILTERTEFNASEGNILISLKKSEKSNIFELKRTTSRVRILGC